MMTLFWTLFFIFCSPLISLGQSPSVKTYTQRCAILKSNIERHFWDGKNGYYREFTVPGKNDKPFSYLWPLCGLVQAANEWEALSKKAGYLDAVLQQMAPYWDETPPAPAYNAYPLSLKKEDRFYDDNQWIGLACMDAFVRTRQQRYLQKGKEMYRFMMTGFDTVSGGGLYWKEGDPSTKNTCSNGPGVLLALQLYKTTKEKVYLDTAMLLYRWTTEKLLSPEGVFYDNVKLPSGEIDKRVYTYNAGTMLQSNVLLYEITGEAEYLKRANSLAEAAYRVFFKNGRWPDHIWFNAVLLRGYEALLKHNPEKKFVGAFMADGEAIWKDERDAKNLIGKQKKKNLLDQAALLEIFARLAGLKLLLKD